MRINGVLILGLSLLISSCAHDNIDKVDTTECPIDNIINSKDAATTLIVGKWSWARTTYKRKGVGITTETPLSAQKTLTLEFTGEKVRIIENSTLTEEQYEIKFWGEDTNIADGILAVKFFKMTGELHGTSMLLLNTSGTCLTLVNSYNDAGGDLNFKRVD